MLQVQKIWKKGIENQGKISRRLQVAKGPRMAQLRVAYGAQGVHSQALEDLCDIVLAPHFFEKNSASHATLAQNLLALKALT